jgi:hypothetical protein
MPTEYKPQALVYVYAHSAKFISAAATVGVSHVAVVAGVVEESQAIWAGNGTWAHPGGVPGSFLKLSAKDRPKNDGGRRRGGCIAGQRRRTRIYGVERQ